MEKIKHRDNLVENVVLSAEISCSKCYKTKDVGGVADEFDAAAYFYLKGWRGTENYTYCPDCARKYLKQTK